MELARDVAAVAAVLGLLFAMLKLARRGGFVSAIDRARGVWPTSKAPEKDLQKLERVTLTPQHSLHLVRFGTRTLVIATHPGGSSVLAESPDNRKGASA